MIIFFPNTQILFLFVLLFSTQVSAHQTGHSRLHLWNKLILEEPKKASHYLHRAQANAEVNHWRQAFKDLEKAKSLGEVISSEMLKGQFFQYKGKYEKSLHVYNNILTSHPEYLPALQERAKLHKKMNNFKMALQDFLVLLKKQPELSTGTYIEIAKIISKVDANAWPRSLQVLDTRMATTGPIPQLQYAAIDIEREHKRYAEAIKRMQLLNSSIKNTAKWHVDMAKLYGLMSDKNAVKEKVLQAESILMTQRMTPEVNALKEDVKDIKNKFSM
ncbi:exported hypothetical protein [uncultured Thiomicrorhabdus sp.]